MFEKCKSEQERENETDRLVCEIKLTEIEGGGTFAIYESVNGGLKLSMTFGPLEAKYMAQLLEMKAELQQKGLPKEEIRAKLQGIYPEAELAAFIRPERLNTFVQGMVATALEMARLEIGHRGTMIATDPDWAN
jgi:hypothetical protein